MKLYRSTDETPEPPYLMAGLRDAFPFDIESDKWEIVYNLPDADVVPIGCLYMPAQWAEQVKRLKDLGCTKKQLLLIMNVFDDCDTYDWYDWYIRFRDYMQEQGNFRCVMVTNNKRDWTNPNEHFFQVKYDLMFNREKAYMTETDKFEVKNRVYFYYGDSKANFRLNPIQKIGTLKDRKIVLCPNRIMKFNQRSGLRRILKTYMQDKPVILGDPASGKILEPEGEGMLEKLASTENGGGGLWFPIANKYYEQTYISVFIETCTVTNPLYNSVRNPHQTVTEKTFDPLIKGHFILPFGYAGIIKDIKSYGFKLPDWIDYSYDDIDCDRHRFAAFLEEADRLIKKPIFEIETNYVRDFDNLIHNRQIFWSKPYVPLYHQVLERFKTIN